MEIGKVIYNILSNDSNVASLVTTSGNTRIFPSRYNFPTDVKLPYITYQMFSDVPNNTKNGVSEYDYVRVQISIYHNSYADMITLAGHVRTALDYVSGTYNGVIVDKIFYQDQNELYDDSAGSIGLYGIAQDYRFNINR
jgi:hypothetical protein|tara:strand:- start:56 stop:472 length:417 start_codon:yes stop_codon:yes gene_type:complete